MHSTSWTGFKALSWAAVLGTVTLLSACDGDNGAMGIAGATGPAGPAGPSGADAGTPPPAACTAVSPLPAGLPATAVALTSAGKLVRFTPGSTAGGNVLNVLGLQAGEELLGIDYRPADGALIALTKNGTAGAVLRIDAVTGETTRFTRIGAIDLTLAGTRYGVDFNPVPGALRIVGDNEENYRLVFSGAALDRYTVNLDTALTPAGNVVAAAYTNNFTGTPVTTLYNLDSTANTLLVQGGIDGAANPNTGTLATVPGGLGVDFDERAGFDVDGVTGIALAALNVAGASSTGLYSVDLGTGAAVCIGTVPAPVGERAVGLAIATPAPAVAYGLTVSNALVSFTPNAAGVASATAPVAITGLGANDTVVGIDVRPRTGVLTALTRDTVTHEGKLYTLDPVTGAASLIAANAGMMLAFDAVSTVFGVDFNPVPNALRIVNDTEQNLRLTFPAGTAGYNVNTDLAINPAVGSSSAAGYTNNFDGATATRLYVIDTTSNELKFQSPPNDGVQTVVGPLGVTTADGNSGMDIIGGAGVTAANLNIGNTVTYAALTVGAVSNLYRINLETGAATQVGTGPIGGASPVLLKGLAVRVRK